MEKPVKNCVCFGFVIVVSLSTATQGAEQNGNPQQELEQVNTAIEEIQSWLTDANSQQTVEEQTLRTTEITINETSLSISNTQKSIDQLENELSALRTRISELDQARTNQTHLLEQAIRSAYMSGERNYLKLILNQEDVALGSRMAEYYKHFNQSRVEQIENYEGTLQELAQTRTELETTANILNQNQAELNQQRQALAATREARVLALAELQTAIVSRGQELEQLVSNQADLEALIQQIELARQRIPALDERIPFVEQRGNLPRPLAGRLVYGFGSPYGNGNLQRQGIGIYAEEGAQVRAVHGGRVLFANWLQGSGLLLILDHGDGYMSLYGANQSLLNKAGDWVNTGDAIATAGDSGNRDQVALYFEIRLRGQAQDPAIWLGD
ncbi:MAG: peptidoglycan DD-metalloendopeptidase family protein [Gammaproteobacteria bacterium]|jgi:septal ring factor EnvC (AmiA/AmiB activator)|nr:hypothetical protein [Gammaproteobacteria bacterium]MDP6097196.1 peptidoglycan DD-metalloendopeptidase family protein [Gammaproteobacteria bacterium]HJO12864.1 peptidoglycan DD-metalloendopeptidase family protein [Gammaproteobacteria bacterium]|tara:strand:+ start:4725 stop:5879 length:1155 start_codon:yes stop_codon:yes gene_type:complete